MDNDRLVIGSSNQITCRPLLDNGKYSKFIASWLPKRSDSSAVRFLIFIVQAPSLYSQTKQILQGWFNIAGHV
jgi:hypothetical protein